MPSKPSGPVRRGQLVAPFGVGSLVIVPGGVSLIVGGLDRWFNKSDQSKHHVEPDEFTIMEWRLQRLLGVNHFRLAPDFRTGKSLFGSSRPNIGLTVPSYRFPKWHFCPDCKRLEPHSPYNRGKGGQIQCAKCKLEKKIRYMYQVPFVAMCEEGHIQDFPWLEWVHKSANPRCQGPLQLKATGSASLSGQKVECETCGASRTLAGITSAQDHGAKTTLSHELSDGEPYLCQGEMPWLGPDVKSNCGKPLRGSLRSASNLYFAVVRSSIYIPLTKSETQQELEDLFRRPGLNSTCRTVAQFKPSDLEAARVLRPHVEQRTDKKYSDSEIIATFKAMFSSPALPTLEDSVEEQREIAPDSGEDAFRREEFAVLRDDRKDKNLVVRRAELSQYDSRLTQFLSRISLVERLQETRAFTGFTRVYGDTNESYTNLQSRLRRSAAEGERWLPANVVFGEGLYLELDESRLRAWETQPSVVGRVRPLQLHYQQLQQSRKARQHPLSPRFVLLHTFAHIVMNRLTFECGYSSAALRERLYVSDDTDGSMAGVLIYTADGDSDGTMGGLVRMGKPGRLEPVIMHALDGARWCSADPVCMEIADQGGQGPDSCNLAACHNCALVPETACEVFNRFLDRGLVVGKPDDPELGYFSGHN